MFLRFPGMRLSRAIFERGVGQTQDGQSDF